MGREYLQTTLDDYRGEPRDYRALALRLVRFLLAVVMIYLFVQQRGLPVFLNDLVDALYWSILIWLLRPIITLVLSGSTGD